MSKKMIISESSLVETAQHAALDRFEENLRSNPHLTLTVLHTTHVGTPWSLSQFEHFQSCLHCQKRANMLLPVIHEELEQCREVCPTCRLEIKSGLLDAQAIHVRIEFQEPALTINSGNFRLTVDPTTHSIYIQATNGAVLWTPSKGCESLIALGHISAFTLRFVVGFARR